MGKKKRKKSSGNVFRGFANIFSYSAHLILKSLPFLLVIGAAGGIFLGIREALYADSNLTIQKVTVLPVQSLSAQQRGRLETQLLGKNILKVDIEKISEGLEKDPAIQSAHILRQMPFEVKVQVDKRVPIAFMRFSPRGSFGVISHDGMILDVVDEKAATGLIIEAFGYGFQQPAIGKQIRQRNFLEAVKFLEYYHDESMSSDEPVTKILLDHLGNVSVYLKDGPEIRLGRQPSTRVDAMKKIVPLLQSDMRKKIDYIDLQFDDVVVKQKKGVQ